MKLFGNKKENSGDKSSSPVASEKTKSSVSFLKRTVSKIGSLFSKTNTENTAEPMSNAKYLGEIYKLMVQNSVDIKLEREQQVNFREEEDSEEQKRHSEIIRALTIRRRPKPKAVIRREKKAEEKAKEPPKKTGEPPKKPADPAKPAETPKKPADPAKPAETPKKPADPAKPAEKPVEKAKKEVDDGVKKAAEEKARKDAQEAAKKAAETKAKKEAEEKAKKAAEEKAKKAAEEKAKKETAEKLKKEEQERLKREAAEKAKSEKLKKDAESVKPPTATQKPPAPTKPSAAETAVKVATGTAGVAGMSAAAAASIKLETGSDASQAIKKVGQIVDNDPKAGIKSYGVFGLNSGGKNVKESSIGSFVKENPQFGFKSTIASKEFDNEWTNIANTRPKELLDAQLAWYDRHVAKPALKDLSGFPVAIVSDPRVILYMTDRRNQYGGQGLKSALKKVKSVTTAEEFIDKMTEIDLNNIEKDFKTYLETNPKNKPGLVSRIEKRKQMALNFSKTQEVTKTEEKLKQVNSNANLGTQVNQSSIQNKDMKKQDTPAPINIQQNTTNVNNTTESSNAPKVDDRPAHQRK
jgi:hypothetical protein